MNLNTISMDELYDTVYNGRPPLIEGLLYSGTYLFVGAPKLGKSFLMAQIAYHVSTGIPLWGYPVRKGTVLYLALEDDYRRLQERSYRMFGTESTENLHFAVTANQLGRGLNEQLTEFIRQQEFERIRQRYDLKGNLRLSGEKQSNVMCEFVITSDKEFFDRLGAERTKQFFADAYNFVTAKAGENFVISEVVHMDEARRSSSHFEGGNNCTQRRTAKTDRGIDRTTERGSDSEHGTKKSQYMFQALQEKFDRVMRFIESFNLKKRLEEFLKPSERKR